MQPSRTTMCVLGLTSGALLAICAVPAQAQVERFINSSEAESVGIAGGVGACCNPTTGQCSQETFLDCEDWGNIFHGVGSECGVVCANDPWTSCAEDTDCPACEFGESAGSPCDCPGYGTCTDEDAQGNPICEGGDSEGAPCDPVRDCGSGTCTGFSTCLDVLHLCTTAACCDQWTGDCVETTGGSTELGFCDGSVCDNDPDNVGCVDGCPGGTCVNVTEYIFQGFGTRCDPNCCEQPVQTGADECSVATVHPINVPYLGEPAVTVTITGNSSAATGPDSCMAVAPDGVWWEVFHILDCADVTIDSCCNDPAVPFANVLTADCPCECLLAGEGLSECIDGNPRTQWRDLPPGTYYYPIPGTTGYYQMHISVKACDVAACCLPTATCLGGTVNPDGQCETNEDCCIDRDCATDPDPGWCMADCYELNRLECEGAEGEFLEGVVACYGDPCAQPRPQPPAQEPPQRLAQGLPQRITQIIDTDGDGTSSLGVTGGIAVDGSNNVYVTGWVTNNAFKITPGGVITEIIDATGDGPNSLWGAVDIAVDDASGNVFVAGRYSDNAFKITQGGVITEIIDADGDGENILKWPWAIAVDAQGNVYVPCWWYSNAFKIAPGGAITRIVHSNGDGSNGLGGTAGIAVDGSGNVYVTGHFSNNAFKITPDGTITEIIDRDGDGTNLLFGPGGIAADSSGNVYITGEYSDNAFEITPGGTITQIIDDRGDGANSLDGPRGIAVDGSGFVYVTGHDSDNVFKIMLGDTITEIIDAGGDGTNSLDAPWGVTVDESGNVFVGGYGSHNAFRIQPCGDGVEDPGEDCDDGYADNCGTCNADCSGSGTGLGGCGDGIFCPEDNNEQCDDANGGDGDGCSSTCTVEDGWSCAGQPSRCSTTCGDGVTLGFEVCDDGYTDPCGSCNADCTCSGDGSTCGDGELCPETEECDDGNTDDGDGCSVDCVVEEEWTCTGEPSTCTAACWTASAPEPERLPEPAGPVNVKNRFLSIRTADLDLERVHAIRVRFVNLPVPFDVWEYDNPQGIGPGDYFVGPPREVCENSGKGLDTPPEECPPSRPTYTFWAAPLLCNREEAHSMDWHGKCADGVCVGGLNEGETCVDHDDCVEYVHLYHEGIVPGGVYDVQVIDSTCSLYNESGYSAPLTMTQARWSDVCGPSPDGACTSVPDGVVDVTNDVLGVLLKFANVNYLQKARADLEPGDNGFNNGPDFKVNVANDVLFTLDAFAGAPYPFAPGDPCNPD